MSNIELSENELAGENLVEKWLSGNSYKNITKENLQKNENVLIAKGNIESILVRVKTFVHPQGIYKLSEYDIDKTKRRAARQKRIAYVAYVVIDTDKNLVGEILWERLG